MKASAIRIALVAVALLAIAWYAADLARLIIADIAVGNLP